MALDESKTAAVTNDVALQNAVEVAVKMSVGDKLAAETDKPRPPEKQSTNDSQSGTDKSPDYLHTSRLEQLKGGQVDSELAKTFEPYFQDLKLGPEDDPACRLGNRVHQYFNATSEADRALWLDKLKLEAASQNTPEAAGLVRAVEYFDAMLSLKAARAPGAYGGAADSAKEAERFALTDLAALANSGDLNAAAALKNEPQSKVLEAYQLADQRAQTRTIDFATEARAVSASPADQLDSALTALRHCAAETTSNNDSAPVKAAQYLECAATMRGVNDAQAGSEALIKLQNLAQNGNKEAQVVLQELKQNNVTKALLEPPVDQAKLGQCLNEPAVLRQLEAVFAPRVEMLDKIKTMNTAELLAHFSERLTVANGPAGKDAASTNVPYDSVAATTQVNGIGQVDVNYNGQILRIKDKDGNQDVFRYGDRGQMVYAQIGDSVWRGEDGTHWKRFKIEDGKEKPTTDTFTGTIKIDADAQLTNAGYDRQATVGGSGHIIFQNSGHLDQLFDTAGKSLGYAAPDGTGFRPIEDRQGRPAREVTAADGAICSYDAAGNIDSVRTATGEIRHFERGADNKINRIDLADGTCWQSADGKTFIKQPDGEQINATAVSAGADGSFSFQTGDGKTIKYAADGAKWISDGQGSAVERPDGKHLQIDADGHVTKITDGDSGFSREFKYDNYGNVNEITVGQTTWRCQDGIHWTRFQGNEDGPGVQERWTGKIQVSSNGTLLLDHGSDSRDFIPALGCPEAVRNADGATTSIINLKVDTRTFTYGKDNTITGVKDADGTSWHSNDGLHWTKDGSDNTRVEQLPPRFDMKQMQSLGKDEKGRSWYISKSPNGDFNAQEGHLIALDEHNHVLSMSTFDGATTVRTDHSGHRLSNGPGEKVRSAEDGSVSVESATGNIHYNPDGSTTYTDAAGRLLKVDCGHEGGKAHYITYEYNGDSKTPVGKIEHLGDRATTYDAAGNITDVTLDNGQSRHFERNADGKVVHITESTGMDWKSTDGTHFNLSGGAITADGNVQIDADGTYRFSGGQKTIERTVSGYTSVKDQSGTMRVLDDGSRYLLDNAGNVTEVAAAGNHRWSIERDQTGAVKAITDDHNVRWIHDAKSPDLWQTEDGKHSLSGNFTAAADGNISFKAANGEERLYKLDGSQVNLDARGHVVLIKDKDGKTSEFQYSRSGEMICQRDPDGAVWVKINDSTWHKDGTTEISSGQRTVDADGTLHIGADTRTTDGLLHHQDHSSELTAADGVHLHKDSNGRIDGVTRGDQSSAYHYDDKGQIIAIDRPDGEHLSSTDGLHWQSDKNTNPQQFTISLQADGTAIEHQPDGTNLIRKNDGSTLTIKDGIISAVNGEKYQVSFKQKNGQITSLTEGPPPGTTWSSEDGQHFTITQPDGATSTWQGKIVVNNDGSILRSSDQPKSSSITRTDGTQINRDPSGHIQSEHNPDGTMRLYQYGQNGQEDQVIGAQIVHADGSVVTCDAQGKILRVIDKQRGNSRQFIQYDDKGNLLQYHDNSGTWKSSDGQNWYSNKGEHFVGQVSVDKDGTFTRRSGEGETCYRLDGTILTIENGASKIQNRDGQITDTFDASGQHKHFEYYPDGDLKGEIKQVTEGGCAYTRVDADHWRLQIENASGKLEDFGTSEMHISLDPDGTYHRLDITRSYDNNISQVQETRNTLSGEARTVDTTDSLRTDAANLRIALQNPDAPFSTLLESSRMDTINHVLQGKSANEIALIRQIYEGQGGNLEQDMDHVLSDANLAKACDYLHQKEGQADNAGRIHEALIERQQLIMGRRDAMCEKDIRDTLSSMTASQIQDLRAEYQRRYGTSLDDALGKGLPSEYDQTALKIYLKGCDKLEGQDVEKLMECAAKTQDIDLFKEASAGDNGIHQEGRDLFLKEHADLLAGFSYDDRDYRQAREFAQDGKLSAGSQVNDATGVFSNDDAAIARALHDMTPAERELYDKGKAAAQSKIDTSTLPADDQQAYNYYQGLRSALEDTHYFYSGAKADGLEDSVRNKDGGLVAQLVQKGGLWDGKLEDIMSSIENMSQQQWNTLVGNKEEYKALNDALYKAYGTADYERAMQLIDGKMQQNQTLLTREEGELRRTSPFAQLSDDQFKLAMQGRAIEARLEQSATAPERAHGEQGLTTAEAQALQAYQKTCYEYVQQHARRLLGEVLQDNQHWSGNDAKPVIDSIMHMSPEEKQKYHDDAQYRKSIDDKLDNLLSNYPQEHDFAARLLKRVVDGKPLDSLAMQAGAKIAEGDLPGAIIIISDALRQDPSLRAKLAQDEDFKAEMAAALDPQSYNNYVQPLLQNGKLSVSALTNLYTIPGTPGDGDSPGTPPSFDKDGFLKEVLKLGPEALAEVKALSSDQLDDATRQVVEKVVAQGRMQPEDKLHLFILHAGVSEEEALATLKSMDYEQKRQMFEGYPDLRDDLLANVSSKNKSVAEQLLVSRALTDQEAFNMMRDHVYTSDGYGGVLAGGYDTTRDQMYMALAQYKTAVEDAARNHTPIDPKKRDELNEQMETAIASFRGTKEELANAIVDATIAAAAIGGTVVTGGVSLSLFACTATCAAAFKVGTLSTIEGADYDWSKAPANAVSAIVETAVNMIAPGDIGALAGVGEKAGVQAADLAAQRLASKGIATLSDAARTEFAQSAGEMMRNAIAHGARNLDKETIDQFAAKMVKDHVIEESARQALIDELKSALTGTMEAQCRGYLKTAERYALNGMAGSAGGLLSGTTDAAMSGDWDTQKIINAGASGAVGALVMTGAFDAGGKLVNTLFSREGAAAARAAGEHAGDGHAPEAQLPGSDLTHQRPALPGDASPRPQEAPPISDNSPAGVESNKFAHEHAVNEPLQDGFTNAGAGNEINGEGNLDTSRAGIVIDRANDPVLRQTIDEARRAVTDLGPNATAEQKMAALQNLVRSKFHTGNIGPDADRMINDLYVSYMTNNAGKRMLMGDLLNQGIGGCAEQAMLLKVLADDAGLKASLVRGNGTGGGDVLNHMWVTVDVGGQARVYDPRRGITDLPYTAPELSGYTPGDKMGQHKLGLPVDHNIKPGDIVDYHTEGWKYGGEKDGKVTLIHDAARAVTPEDIVRANPGIDTNTLRAGQEISITGPDGTKQSGWRVAKFEDGRIILAKENAIELQVPRDQVFQHIPEEAGTPRPDHGDSGGDAPGPTLSTQDLERQRDWAQKEATPEKVAQKLEELKQSLTKLGIDADRIQQLEAKILGHDFDDYNLQSDLVGPLQLIDHLKQLADEGKLSKRQADLTMQLIDANLDGKVAFRTPDNQFTFAPDDESMPRLNPTNPGGVKTNCQACTAAELLSRVLPEEEMLQKLVDTIKKNDVVNKGRLPMRRQKVPISVVDGRPIMNAGDIGILYGDNGPTGQSEVAVVKQKTYDYLQNIMKDCGFELQGGHHYPPDQDGVYAFNFRGVPGTQPDEAGHITAGERDDGKTRVVDGQDPTRTTKMFERYTPDVYQVQKDGKPAPVLYPSPSAEALPTQQSSPSAGN